MKRWRWVLGLGLLLGILSWLTVACDDRGTDTPTVDVTAVLVPSLTAPPRPVETVPPDVQTRVSPKDGMVTVYVPAGEFVMGSAEEDAAAEEQPEAEMLLYGFWEAEADEKPQHSVYVDAFWIDQTEVTNGMFAAFLNDVDNQTEGGVTWLDAKAPPVLIHWEGDVWRPFSGYKDHPVIEVTWYGARAYCEWAGRRLPTEAEWEKAARGTDGRIYPWGNAPPTCELCNYDGGCFLRKTTPVGAYPTGKSPYGLLDMAGNVWEWVSDWYDAGYYARSPDQNPQGAASGEKRVIRGGSGYIHQYDVRATDRGSYYPGSAGPDVGFRCAQSVFP